MRTVWGEGVSKILLRCPKCNKQDYDERREGDPVRAMEAVIICPACDDGDFHEMRYFSSTGKQIQEEHD